jgi:hypothetical protein
MGVMREGGADLDEEEEKEEEEEEEGALELPSGQKRIVLRYRWNLNSSVLWDILQCTLLKVN